MSLDVGALVGTVRLETTPFDRAYARLVRKFSMLGTEADRAAAGTTILDDSLVTAARAADKASTSLSRTTATTRTVATAEERAAVAAKAHADAVARVTAVTNGSAAAGQRVVQSQLRLTASQERYDAVMASGAASTRQLAGAQATLIGSERSLAAASLAADRSVIASSRVAAEARRAHAASMVATGRKMSHAFTLPVVAAAAASTKMAGDFQFQMNRMVVAAGESRKNLKMVSAGVLGLMASTGTSAKQLETGLYLIESAGFHGAAGLKVLEVAAKGAKIENADLATVSNAVTSAMVDYKVKAGNAASVMNTLIAGVSQGKTTLGEMSHAFSNVGAAGSKANIPMADLVAALAEMTRHGTDAAKAGTYLRQTIGQLEGGSAKARLVMAGLGLDANKVGLTLSSGSGGLAKAIGMIDTAITQHLKPSGLVAIETFKKSKGSLSDFQKVLGNLPPSMVTTFSALANMTGGVKSLQGFLQLGGTNLAEFKSITDKVNVSVKHGGKSVEGWALVQKTLNQKMSETSGRLQAAAIKIGTALIPAVSKIVVWVGKAVDSFGKLSSTDKKILGWSVGILAALGPVLTLGGRLALVGRGVGTFAVGLGNVFARITGSATGMSLGVTRAVTGVTSALAGVGIGLAVGSLTKGASTTTKVLGALGSTAAGAAIGFGVGGPLGAAIGGIAGGLSALATSYDSSGESAKKASQVAAAALAAQKQSVDDLLGSLQSVNGAYDKQFKGSIIKKLGDSGALGIANKAGVNLPSMVDNVIGKGGPAQIAKMRAQIENALSTGAINPKEYAKLDMVFQNLGLAAGSAESKLQLEAKAAQQSLLPNAQLGVGIQKLRAAFANTGHTIDDSSAASQRNRAIIRQNLEGVNASAVAQLKHGKSVKSVASAYEGQISTLTTNLHKLGFNDTEVRKLIGSYGKMPRSVLTELIKRGVVPADIQAIIDRYNRIPKNKDTKITLTASISPSAIMAQNLLNNVRGSTAFRITNKTSQYAAGGKIPPNTRFTVGEKGWEGGVTDAQGRATIIPHNRAKAMGFAAPTGYASGTGSSYAAIAALLSGLGATRAGIAGWLGNTSAESGGRTSAVGGPAHGLQQWQGGRFGELQAIARRMGVSWSSQAAQLAMIRHELTGGYRGTLNNLRHATSASAAANYVNRHYEISADSSGNRARLAERFYRSGVSAAAGGTYAVGGIQYSSAMAAQNAQVRTQQRLAKAVDTAGVNLAKVAGDSKATAAAVRAATAKLVASASALHASSSALRQAAGYQRWINADAARRTTLMGRLASAQGAYKAGVAQRSADYSSFVAPTRDAFNISDASQYAAATTTRRQSGATISTTTPGGVSLASILASDKAAAGTARRFGADLSALARRGLNKTDVAALAAAGPSADPVARALLGASRAQIAGLNANRTSINSSAGKMASSLAHKFDDAGINAATGLAHGLTSQIGHLDRVMVRLADHMTSALKRRLRIHSPSQVFHDLGTMLPKGLANGIHEKLPEVRRAAGHMADATMPGFGSGTGGGGFAVHHQTVINPAPGMSEREIGRAAASDAVWQLQMIGGLPT